VHEATVAQPPLDDDDDDDGGGGGEDAPGVVTRGGRLLLICADHSVLELRVVQPPGKRAMDAAAYVRGLAGRR
jgi:methionyl-tRNA formyltransferase